MSTTHQSYYDVLQVDRSASPADIKRAFRKLAKRYHPDTNPRRPKAAAQRFKEILTAYNVLRNERERARYDVLLHTSAPFGEKRNRAADGSIASRARGILEDLLRDDGKHALATYDELVGKEGVYLLLFMPMRDYLDCIFLVAEQMERVGRNKEAAQLYEELYEREKEPPRHRHFLPEVKVRLKKGVDPQIIDMKREHLPTVDDFQRTVVPAISHEEKAEGEKNLVEIEAPMVGTFYRAASPESPPFVEVRQEISTDQVLCIIEAMKLMNEIKSEFNGKVVEILVENGHPIEYGQPLFLIKKH